MKAANLVVILSIAMIASSAVAGPSPLQIAQIFEGFFEGFLSQEGFPDLEKCIEDSGIAVDHFENAVKDFEEKTFSGVKNGLEQLGEGFEEVSTVLEDCKNIKADFAKIKQDLQVFKHPLTLFFKVGKALFLNGIQIFKEIFGAVKAYRSSDYVTFGKDVGIALGLVIPLNAGFKTESDAYTHELISGYLDIAAPQFDEKDVYNHVNGMGAHVYDVIAYNMRLGGLFGHPNTLRKVLKNNMVAMMYAAAELHATNKFKNGEMMEIAKGMGCLEKVMEDPDFERASDMYDAFMAGKVREFGQHYARFTHGKCY